MVKLLCAESTAWVILGVSWSANQASRTSQNPPKHGIINLVSGGDFSMGNSNLSRAIQTCSSHENPKQCCGARPVRVHPAQGPQSCTEEYLWTKDERGSGAPHSNPDDARAVGQGETRGS